jgi:hypothetical protein
VFEVGLETIMNAVEFFSTGFFGDDEALGIRAWFSMNSAITSASFGQEDTPSAAGAFKYAGFRFSDIGGDTHWMCCTGKGTSDTATSAGVTPDTNEHRFGILALSRNL